MKTARVVASRTLDLVGSEKAVVNAVVERPRRTGNHYECEFQIDGLSVPVRSRSAGEDSMQALMLALQYIGARLYTSDEYTSGQLSWLGMRNLGFPVPDSVAHLVPPKDG